MLSNLLIRLFIKDWQNTADADVRKQYGMLSGAVGIAVNVLLFLVKLAVGLLLRSIAVVADSFNNLTDVLSSVITVAGFKLAGKPADEEHPFGHGRIEYIAGLIVSFLVILVAFELIKSSLDRILHPVPIRFGWASVLVILVTVAVKVWLGFFYRKLGLAISSKTLTAAAMDSLSDVISSSVIILSLIASLWTTFPVDGYIGVVVAGIIFYSGISLVRETLSPLLGEPPDRELVKEIHDRILRYEGITGCHDLIVHSYGPGKYMASIHAEVPASMDMMEAHELIDLAERQVARDLGIELTIHMDPVDTDSEELNRRRQELTAILTEFPEVLSFHDLRIVGHGEKRNLVFDIVVPGGLNSKENQKLKKAICDKVREKHPYFSCVITVDPAYSPEP